jgi:hypothetical protein
MTNPYEPPQTIGKAVSLPNPASEPEFGVLLGAKRCVRGGKFLWAASMCELVAVMIINEIQRAKLEGPTDVLNLAGWVFIIATLNFLLLGAITNHLAYSRFVALLDHAVLVSIYRTCRGLNWIRLGLAAIAIVLSRFIVIPEHKVLVITFSTTIMLSFAQSYWQHFKAMKTWRQHFSTGLSQWSPRFYVASGMTGTILGFGLVAYSYQEQRDPSFLVAIVWLLILAISFAAFARFYQQLAKQLAELPSSAVLE